MVDAFQAVCFLIKRKRFLVLADRSNHTADVLFARKRAKVLKNRLKKVSEWRQRHKSNGGQYYYGNVQKIKKEEFDHSDDDDNQQVSMSEDKTIINDTSAIEQSSNAASSIPGLYFNII